ncbi:MAG: MipA/OmpV family protein [Planctomycetota bacterium]
MGAKGESFELTLERPLGERGLFTVGVGGIWQSSPYVDYDGGVFQPIPAITYIGDRFQILGPNVQVRLFGTDRLRLGATARYRIGAYEEDESDALQGLGDRDDTLMAGLSLRYDIPRNFELQIGYEHDALDRIRGGEARVLLARPFQIDVARLSPRIGFRWLDSDLADYDFGVPSNAARPGRPAYSPGGSLNLEVGLGAFIEITRNWRLILDLGVQFLDSDLQDSPIVDEDVLLQGFAALSYAF